MQKIGIFVGASYTDKLKYIDSITQLAKQLVKRKFGLVYGGASVGLMGYLANTVLALGGEVIGVIPKSLMVKEIAHQKLTKLHIVESMQARKTMMSNLSDAFITLPGGLGTLEETFEIWNSIKIGLHKKPFGFLNIDGYFDSLFQFLKHASKEGFIEEDQLNLIIKTSSANELLDSINAFLGKFTLKNLM